MHNLVVSNVPGPQVPLYFLGSEVKAMYPLGPIFHGSGLNITVMSLNGKLDVGIVSCPELLPDLWDLADDFEVALDELLASAARPAGVAVCQAHLCSMSMAACEWDRSHREPG